VSAYVELAFPVVLERFSPPDVDELLVAAVRAGLEEHGVTVRASAEPVVWVSSGHVRVPVTWHVDQSHGAEAAGSGTLSLLVVQSGHDAITELLATVPAPDVEEERAVAALHQVLQELTTRLEAAGP
jgi:hypothetical protein